MKKLLISFILLLSVSAVYAQTSIQVQAHKVVSIDEQFNVTFVIEGAKPTDFSWEPGSDFDLVWGPQQGRSTSIQIVNGKRTESSQTTYSYILRPLKAGKFTLAQASAKIKGNEIYSNPHAIEVVSSGSSSGQSSQPSQNKSTGQQAQQGNISDSDLFLRLSLNRSEVVVGEPVVATVKLYQRVNVSGFEGVSFPSFNGFWSQEIEAPSNIEFHRETYDGQIYNAAVLRKFLLIPQHQGKIRIDPAELVCLVSVRVSSGGNSIFDGFFDEYRNVRKKVQTSPVTINVSPLPAGAPASFAGGVGEFTISASVSKDSLKTHEAASLVVTVTGKGNVSLLETPKVSFPPDMEVYDTKVTSNIAPGGMSGTRKYEYPFIPRSHGDFVIEPIKYSYYDVNQKKYVTLETKPIDLVVLKGNESGGSAAVISLESSQKDVKNLDSDIRYINVKDPLLSSKGHFLVGSGLFWVIASLLVATAVALWLLLRRMAARKADIAGTKNRKATKMAMKRLQLAGTFLKQNLYTAFYEELHKALLGFISDKLTIPVAELSKDRISEALKEGSVPEEYISTFIGILDACEFARYSPSTGNDAMAAHYAAAADVISAIDSSMKTKRSGSKSALLALLLMVVPFAAHAQEDAYVDSLWNAANTAYAEGQWEVAVSGYEMISDMGLESAALYCNTGNAYAKSGNVPLAILYYERALKLDPSYEDAAYNLQMMNARIQDRIDPVPEFFLTKWMKDISYLLDTDAWAIVALVLLGLTLAMFLLFLLAPSVAGRRTGFFTGLVFLVFLCFASGFSVSQKKAYMSADKAIVTRPVVSVKSSPSAEASKDLFILHEGTKVTVLDQVGTWNNISLADGRQGWLPAAAMERI
ncbi:MAG: BatD family protein [Bacteroidales bacterium]|nr:BatD family protein [Bacteroidales bacterium]